MATQTFDNRPGFIWMNGALVPWTDARLHVLSHAMHYASSVFEGERAYGGVIFKGHEHHLRLKQSAEILDFTVPYSVEEIDAAADAVVAANKLTDAYVRPVAWRGSEMMGVSAQATKINVAIAAWEWPAYFSPELKAKGIRLDMAPWRRPAPDSAPTQSKAAGLYMICTMSKHAAERKGFQDALMLDYRGLVAEATGANVFLVIDGQIHTPVPDCFLNGITRRTVIALARREGFEVIERQIALEDLDKASEIFLTGTAAEVTPVGEIDGRHYNPGRVCHSLVDAYQAEVRKPAEQWVETALPALEAA